MTGQVETARGALADPAFMDVDSPEFARIASGADFKDPEDDLPVDDEAAADTGKPVDAKPPADPVEKGEQDRAAPGADKGTTGQETAEADVLSPDGKGRIPYAVLKQERIARHEESEARRMAEQARDDAVRQAEDLRRQLDAAKSASPKPGDAVDVEITPTQDLKDIDAGIAVLEQNFPDMAAPIKAMAAELKALRGQIQPVHGFVQQQQRTAAESERDRVQEAIDNNPTLTTWATHGDPKFWNAAVEHDVALRSDPYWKAKPMDKRFEEVVRRVVELVPGAPVPSKQESEEQIRLRAEAALKAAGTDDDPGSLSHLPGGASPTGGEPNDMSALQLEAWMEGKSEAEIARFLERHS